MSSKRRQRRRQCESKRRFETRGEAGHELVKMALRGKARPGLHVYRCPWCGGYHLGRTDGRFKHRSMVKAWEKTQGV